MDISERIAIASTNTSNRNCFGTALYLAGLLPQDQFLDLDFEGRKLGPYLEEDPLRSPRKGSVVLYWFLDTDLLVHMGVVTRLSPLRITHRFDTNGPLIVDDKPKKIIREYESYPEYRQPKVF
jgi:hypothetical protein